MAEFIENQLREEERAGSFNPGTPDDETFYLETLDAYPGELPDYSEFEKESTISLEEQLDLTTASTVGTVVENITLPTADESILEEILPEEINKDEAVNLSLLEDSYEDKKEIENPPDESNSVWDLFEENKEAKHDPNTAVLGEEPEESIDKEQDDLIEKKISDQSPSQNENVEMDDDFKRMLENDLAKKKPVQAKVEEYSNITDDVSDFHPVEEENNFDEIDLSRLDADHPSTYHHEEEIKSDNEESVPKIEPEIVFVDSAPKAEKPPKEKPKKEKKKGKAKYLFIAAALLAFFVLFGAVTYDWGVNRGGFADYFGFGKHHDNVTENKEKHIEKKDLAKHTAKHETKVIVDTVKHDIEPKEEIIDTVVLAKAEIPEEKPIVDKPKHISQATPTVITKPKSTPKQKIAIPIPKEVKVANQIYTVQVYATPSKEDAEAWVQRLQRKNVKDIFISTQKKRDQDWFKVRFGSYSSLEEAKKAASEIGFSQTWIDRIK